ncbi:MAG: hypothetical protein ACKOB0_08815 [Chthoniobacterales bacterium]
MTRLVAAATYLPKPRFTPQATRHYAMALRFLVIAAAIILLAAIATCSLSSSSYMTQIPFIPKWLGTWALLSDLPDLRTELLTTLILSFP